LGHHEVSPGSIFDKLDTANAQYEIFVAEQIGALIAMAPGLTSLPSKETAKINIRICADRCFDGSAIAFCRYFGLSCSSAEPFGRGKEARFTSLRLLLRVAFVAEISVFDLLTSDCALSNFSARLSEKATTGVLAGRRNKNDVLRLLTAATTEKPPPSLRDVATRLGYSSNDPLRNRSAALCNLITANYQSTQPVRESRKGKTFKRRSSDVVEAALRAALRKKSPPPLLQVARSLGYCVGANLRLRFPDLCQALAEKRQSAAAAKKSWIEAELRKSLTSNPPEPMNGVSIRLGYKTDALLRTTYPELCKQIRARYKAHLRAQLHLRIESELRVILLEVPPSSLKAALRRLGISDRFLRNYFLSAHRAIASRYLAFRREQKLIKKTEQQNRIEAIVRELVQQGTFPSTKAVCDVLKPTAWVAWSTIKKAREIVLAESMANG
jgi:methylphosphotriester-DNA--protein-cysteine methyltransferase